MNSTKFTALITTLVLAVVTVLGTGGTAQTVLIPASARVDGVGIGPGLNGFYHDLNVPPSVMDSLAKADAVITSSPPTAIFRSTLVDYPRGGAASLFIPRLDDLLGPDAASLNPSSIGPTDTSGGSVWHFTGFINITNALDTVPDNSTIDVQFGLASDDGSRVKIGGQTVVNIDGIGFFFPGTAGVANFEAPGLYPVDIVWYDHFGGIGIEWSSSIPSGPGGIVPTSVLFQQVAAPEPVAVDIDPDIFEVEVEPDLQPKEPRGAFLTAIIKPPEGVSAVDIDASTVTLLVSGTTLATAEDPVLKDNILQVIFRLDLMNVGALLGVDVVRVAVKKNNLIEVKIAIASAQPTDLIELTVSGDLIGGGRFSGTDAVLITAKE